MFSPSNYIIGIGCSWVGWDVVGWATPAAPTGWNALSTDAWTLSENAFVCASLLSFNAKSSASTAELLTFCMSNPTWRFPQLPCCWLTRTLSYVLFRTATVCNIDWDRMPMHSKPMQGQHKQQHAVIMHGIIIWMFRELIMCSKINVDICGLSAGGIWL